VYEVASCENGFCHNAAVKMVTNPVVAAKIAGKTPPLYLCHGCTQVMELFE